MNQVSVSGLNDLSRSYALGEIDFYSYRQQRTLLLDHLTGEDGDSSTSPGIEKTESVEIPAAEPAKREHTDSPQRKRRWGAVLLAALLLSIGAATLAFLYLADNSSLKGYPTEGDETRQQTAKPAGEVNFAAAISAVYNSQNWLQAKERLESFERLWQESDESSQRRFLESHQYQKIAFSIREELEALHSVDDLAGYGYQQEIEILKRLAKILEIQIPE